MKCRVLLFVLAVGILGGLVGCRTAAVPKPQLSVAAAESIILWWSRYAKDVENITHVVNDVWVGDRENPGDRDPDHHQDAWLERGVIPLRWAGGRVYASEGVDGLVGRWSGPLEDGFLGLAIDEFGDRDPEVDRVLREALLRIRELYPQAYLAVWHGGLIDGETADVYRRAADLVMIELYRSGSRFLGLKYGLGLANVRAHGLEAKTVVAIGVEDERFASDPDAIQAQIGWLRRTARDFAGIGIYASQGGRHLVMAADEALHE